jgi:hypothetical protein
MLQEMELDIAELMPRCPPVWKHAHKRAVHEKVRKEGGEVSGTLRYTRWGGLESLGEVEWRECEVEVQAGFYTYGESNRNTWHVNFADPRLFVAYGSALLAQDELQVLEHPVLGSLREALLDAELPALTRENGRSTPVLVMGVPRQCAIDVLGQAGDGARWRWWGRFSGGAKARVLYGNAFQQASVEEVLRATTVLRPPTVTNLIAMAAPLGGAGAYTRKQLVDVLETACCGFAAAIMESRRGGEEGVSESVRIHTGWWGCGAFGGNKVVMGMLQMLAARIAGVAQLVFHVGAEQERGSFEEARVLLDELMEAHPQDVARVIEGIERRGFRWGVSDGN